MNREQSGGERRKNALFAKIKVEWRERERERAKFRGKLMSRSFILSNTVLMVNWEQMFSVTWIYLSKIKFLERKCVFLILSLVIFLIFD